MSGVASLVVPVMVGASSLIVAGAATYAAGRVSTAAETIEQADRRSRENRAMLTGERDGTRGVYPWLQELDQEVQPGD
jgi:uncharacterized membrane protein